MKYDKFVYNYKTFAIIFLNLVIIFVLTNLFVWGLVQFKHSFERETPEKYGASTLTHIYPNLTISEIRMLIDETYNRKFLYSPYIEFVEQPLGGKFVNVSPHGFRIIEEQCPYPISRGNFNIFFLGGSTSFGYGVSDFETIPSYLQKILRKSNGNICVYNFGQASYFSTQERIFLEQLILNDQIPDTVIFFDGLNEFFITPDGSSRYSTFLRATTREDYPLKKVLSSFPLIRLINKYISLIKNKDGNGNVVYESEEIVDRYYNNKKMIGAITQKFKFRSYFIIQPISYYHYNLKYHPLLKEGEQQFKYVEDGYGYFFDSYSRLDSNEKTDLIWLGDMQLGKNETLYVDRFHYNAKFNMEIAEAIAKEIKA